MVHHSQKVRTTQVSISGWMNEWNVANTYNRIANAYTTFEGREFLTWTNPDDTMLSERSQAPKPKYCMVPRWRGTQSSQIHRQKVEWLLPGAGRRGVETEKILFNGHRDLVWEGETSWRWMVREVCTATWMQLTPWRAHRKIKGCAVFLGYHNKKMAGNKTINQIKKKKLLQTK